MNDEILEGIKSYCADKESDYAIMITGPWGSGKTYFANNQIKECLKEKKMAYVSLFGITKTEEIDHLVIQAIYPFIKSSSFKVGTALAQTAVKTAVSLAHIDLVLPQLSMPIRNIVIIFDDLERASEFLRIPVLLGYISRYCAQRQVKCIIICNEEEIKNLSGEDSDDRNKSYLSAKEKIVRYTYKFDFDVESIVEHLSKVSQDASEKLALKTVKSKKEILLNLPKEHEVNARTLITLYNLTKRFADKSGTMVHDEYYTEFTRNTALCILAYLLESKTHDTGFNEIEKFIEKHNEYVLGLSRLNKKPSQANVQPEKIEQLYNRLQEITSNRVVYFSSVAAHLVYNGVASQELINNEYDKFIEKVYPKQSIEVLLLGDYSRLTDEDFNQALIHVYKELNTSDELSLSDIMHIALFLHYFIEMKVTNLYDLDALERHVKDAITRCSNKYPARYSDDQEVSRLRFIYGDKLEYVGSYLEYVIKNIVPYKYIETTRKDAEDVWQIICNNNDTKFLHETFGNGSKWINQPFFSVVSHEKILDGILSMDNHMIRSFISVIDYRYNVSNNRDMCINELNNIKRIFKGLEQYIESKEDAGNPLPLSLYYKKMFLDKLKELLIEYGLNDQ